MSQAIIIGCIHAQARSIFRRNNDKIDPINISKVQIMYDQQRDSDSLMLLRVYQEWMNKFHGYLKIKQDEPNKNQNGSTQRREIIKRPS